ncbi:MAG: hypothetical protein IPN33_21660 [Saprospiraceae bacterium]|nr:hypothetical protein [Saprospiraceae bacterium]
MRMRLYDCTTIRLYDYTIQIGRTVAQSHSRIVFLTLLLLPVLCRAQEAPPVDTLPPAKDTSLAAKWPVPRKALLWSIAPGGGQIYNKRWWKLPLVYGAFAGIVYSIDYNQGRYRRLKTALALKLDGLDHEWTGTTLDNARTLRILRDKYDKNTQLSYVGIVLVYALQGIEAFTDAHLRNFDIGDDLSMRIQPAPAIHQLSGAPLTRAEHSPATQSAYPCLREITYFWNCLEGFSDWV